MNNNELALDINGTFYTGWEECTLEFDMEVLPASFELSLFDKGQALSRSLRSGLNVSLYSIDPVAGTDKLLKGFISGTDRSSGGSSNSMTVSGDDVFIDPVECSAIHRSQTWYKKRFSGIVADLLKPYGLKLDTRLLKSDPKIDKFTLQSSETSFAAIERLCRSQAVLPLSQFDGTLLLGYAATSDVRASEDLEVGVNCKDIKELTDWSGRHSEYIALGQQAGNGKRWTKEMLQGRRVAKDAGVLRYRPKLFIAESRSDNKILRQRVNWEAQIRSGRSSEYTVVVSGWYQRDAQKNPLRLWVKNERVNLKYTEWDLNTERLITKVVFTMSGAGTQTVLTLKHPDIFKPDPGEEVDLT